jgi:hypothetical protein
MEIEPLPPAPKAEPPSSHVLPDAAIYFQMAEVTRKLSAAFAAIPRGERRDRRAEFLRKALQNAQATQRWLVPLARVET